MRLRIDQIRRLPRLAEHLKLHPGRFLEQLDQGGDDLVLGHKASEEFTRAGLGRIHGRPSTGRPSGAPLRSCNPSSPRQWWQHRLPSHCGLRQLSLHQE